MTKMGTALMILAVVATLPTALHAQSNVTQPTVQQPSAQQPVPQSNLQSDAAQATAGKFIIAPDMKNGGVWRLNADTGELWFCLALGTPQCHLAVNKK